MSRRKQAPKRDVLPDPLFHSKELSKFMNTVMMHGKKSVAEGIVYGALDIVISRIKKDDSIAKLVDSISQKSERDEDDRDGGSAGSTGGSTSMVDMVAKLSGEATIRNDVLAREIVLHVFDSAMKKVTPNVEVKSRRVGGSTYQVPINIQPKRGTALARRWMVTYAKKRGEKTMSIRLANEILDSLSERGGSAKKREDVHRMAKANQAFAHYRW